MITLMIASTTSSANKVKHTTRIDYLVPRVQTPPG